MFHLGIEKTSVKTQVQKSAGKVMLTGFSDIKGEILKDDMPLGNAVSGQYYADLLAELKLGVQKMRYSTHFQNVCLLPDNMFYHKAWLVQLFV